MWKDSLGFVKDLAGILLVMLAFLTFQKIWTWLAAL